jgi:predicted ATPase/DNA-binding XRE family transcriptional regulator
MKSRSPSWLTILYMAQPLGTLLKDHRASAGMTQEELAEKAEVSARTVSDVERGLRTRVYRDTAGRLAEALGLAGAQRIEFEVAARGRASGSGSGPAPPLPTPPTRLIGRDRELEVILAALERPEVRILTLTGPGGIGKTRLALETAARVRFSGGVFFVQLGNLSDATHVVGAVARSVGVSGAKDPTVEAIAEHLGDARVLLVLDTFEHVLAAAADVAALIAACEGATVLATSREALRVRGEHEVSIPTLSTPARPTMEEVLSSPATTLFIERALAVRPSLTIDERSAEAIAEICGRVNGLPLAIELAAARAKHLSLDALRDQLEHRLHVLVGGPRDVPRRQRTMRDTVAWSYELLEPDEQELLRDLSVFSGGWTLDAASVVCGRDVLPGLSALVDKSLVTVADHDDTRYDMLDTVREFGGELREGEPIDRRHLDHFLSLAEEAEPELGRAAQHRWLERLEREHDNIRAAMRYALRRRDAGSALRIGGAVWRFWLLHGYLSEGRRTLREGLDADSDSSPQWRAKALWGLAWLAYHQGDYPEAHRCGEEMLAIARVGDDPVERRNALTIQGIVDLAYGRFAEAVDVLDRCVELLRDREPGWLLATSLLNLGMATAHALDTRALSILQRSRDLYSTLGDRHYEARAVLYSGYASLLQGDGSQARAFFRESLISFWELEDLWGTTEALEGAASIAGVAGSGELAATLAAAAEALRERINARPFPADLAVKERSLATVKSAMDDAAWQERWRIGRSMSVDDAVSYALEDRD